MQIMLTDGEFFAGLLVVLGLLLTLVGVYMILSKGLALVLWVVLLVLGLWTLQYGLGQPVVAGADAWRARVQSWLVPGREMSRQVLEGWCQQLQDAQRSVPASYPSGTASERGAPGDRHE
ncbi:MAG: hypothetical protein H7831_06060 [Magnetococcus sp. WYHC-3]